MTKKENLTIVILAGGLGTRMKSSYPKVMHRLCEKPILWWVLNSVSKIKSQQLLLVLGHGMELISEQLKLWRGDFGSAFLNKIRVVKQEKQLGSGDALKSAARFLSDKGTTLVLSGDVPLISTETLRSFCTEHLKSSDYKHGATVLSGVLEEPTGYGRIVKDSEGGFLKIIEEKDATISEKRIKEVNSGIYLFSNIAIKEALKDIKPLNVKREYYLTDVVEILRLKGWRVVARNIAAPDEILGVNNRWELSVAEKKLRLIIIKNHALNGVTFIDPENTYIGPDVVIKNDTTIYPNTVIKGRSTIGSGCVIGCGCYISDTTIGDDVKIRASFVYESKIESGVHIGPFAHIRPGSVIGKNARIGNFTEIKKSHIGSDTKVSHLAYIGDSHLEENINIGAGAITCNYDGKTKHKTYIGKDSFIGSNVNLIAPVTIGKNVLIAAGSTITEDVPDGMLAIERGRQINKKRSIK